MTAPTTLIASLILLMAQGAFNVKAQTPLVSPATLPEPPHTTPADA